MILVNDIFTEVQRVLGTCDEPTTFARLTEAQELLANLSPFWDPMVGSMDICTCARTLVLPNDVEVPLAINIGGRPADFRNKWFEFHLNGPGSDCCSMGCGWNWADNGETPTFQTIRKPSRIFALSDLDEGASTSIRVFGFDKCEKWIMTTNCDGVLVDGFEIPVLYGIGAGIPVNIEVSRITRVFKPITRGFVRLVALEDGCHQESGTLLGYYLPNEQTPNYRSISLNGARNICQILDACNPMLSWVRMKYRRKTYQINSKDDVIFLHSPTAIKMAVQMIKKYENDLPEEYVKYEKLAKKALMDEQRTRSGPNQIKIQMQRPGFMSRTLENMI